MIWCVEDDASIRDIEIYALRAAGFEVQGFPDGDSFWDALQQQHPDLVVPSRLPCGRLRLCRGKSRLNRPHCPGV